MQLQFIFTIKIIISFLLLPVSASFSFGPYPGSCFFLSTFLLFVPLRLLFGAHRRDPSRLRFSLQLGCVIRAPTMAGDYPSVSDDRSILRRFCALCNTYIRHTEGTSFFFFSAYVYTYVTVTTSSTWALAYRRQACFPRWRMQATSGSSSCLRAWISVRNGV